MRALDGNRAAALAYAGRGWPAFPIAPRTKRPLTEHGCLDASTDPEQLAAWWRGWPYAGVGIATGTASGLVVLDVEAAGMESVAELYDAMGYTPETPTVLTGGGGTHSYFAAPRDGEALPSKTALLAKLDVKSAGGYVVAPPSLHPSGVRYEWSPVLGFDVPLAPFPAELGAFLRQPDPPRPASLRAQRRPPCRGGDVWDCVHRSPRVRARFQRGTEGLHDASPSGVDYALACALAWRGFADPEIREVLEASRHAAGLPPKRELYYRATVAKAVRESGRAE